MGDTWELHGRNMGATVDETWSHVELVWSYRGRTVELPTSKLLVAGKKDTKWESEGRSFYSCHVKS